MDTPVLNGLEAQQGSGSVVEVHLDIMEAPRGFLDRLLAWGFEDDPFLTFYPAAYHFHYTGRTRAAAIDLRSVLSNVNKVIDDVLTEARRLDVRLYAECELVRDIRHFTADRQLRGFAGLHGMAIRKSSSMDGAKADVHVEFVSGTVVEDLRTKLSESGFYWVRTPASDRFPSEDIATLQTSVFRDAQMVFDRLVSKPLPACTGIHLEQKLAMVSSHPDLPLPPVMELAN